MFKNIFKTTIRYFFKNGFFSLINVFGLAVGLATFILIFLFVQDELGYDRHFNDASNIYRLEPRYVGPNEDSHWAASQGNLVPNVSRKYPEIIEACKMHFSPITTVVRYKDQSFNEENIVIADTTFLEFFDFELVAGSADKALSGPEATVITASTAKKYFGKENPIGKILQADGRNLKINAVVKDVPHNTHFHFDIAISMDQFRARRIPADDGGPSAYYSYIKVKDKATAKDLERKLNENAWETLGYVVAGEESNVPEGWEAHVIMQPISNIHLDGHAEKEIEGNSDSQYVYIFSLVAVFLLIIASINYMNLTTAKSFKRGKEVGIRKVMGAGKKEIFNQFMTESYFVVLLAVILAVLIAELCVPFFNDITGKQLSLNLFSNVSLLILLLLVFIFVGFLSGSYPAIFLSRFNPLKVLKGNTLSGSGNKSALYFRRGLVLLQFAISVVLIIGTITVYMQMMYIQNKKLGFDKDNVVVLKTAGIHDKEKIEVFKNQLLHNADVLSVSSVSAIPGERVPFLTVRIPDMNREENQGNDEGDDSFGMRVISADEDVLNTFGFELAEGRSFSKDFGTDAQQAFLLNKAAVEAFELENPVGADFEYLYALPEPKRGKVVGVIEDFHYASLHTAVEPLMIHINPRFFWYLAIRVNNANTGNILGDIEQEWNKSFAGMPFDYFFQDTFYDNMYRSEQNLKSVVTYFTFLAIFVAALGLFGLAAYITRQRTKEIGIRKVLGASVSSIVYNLSKEFVILVLIANAIAIVPAYILLSDWLDSYAFRISFGAGIFIFTVLLSLFISVVTVGMQASKAAGINPSRALRYE